MPFTNESWSSSEADLDADQFCSVCLIDGNAQGTPKVKSKCKLPLRATPGAPYNTNAIRNAMSRIMQLVGVSPEDKRKAARKLMSLAAEGGIEINADTLKRLAGMR